MSLDVYLYVDYKAVVGDATKTDEVYWATYTHNCGLMAKEAGIYWEVWHPDEIGITQARQLIEPLREGIKRMKADPERFKAFNPQNGWGSYDRFVPWLERYLKACEENPDARVETCT